MYKWFIILTFQDTRRGQLSQSLRCFSQFSKVFMLFIFNLTFVARFFFLSFFPGRNGGCCLFEVCQLILYLVLTKVQKAQYTTHSQDSHIYGVLACGVKDVKKSASEFFCQAKTSPLEEGKLILYFVLTKDQKSQYTQSSLTHIRSWVLIKWSLNLNKGLWSFVRQR